MLAAILRVTRTVVAMGLPILISYLTGSPDVRWAGLAPIIMGIAKYLRDTYGWNWLPV